jgi:vacuolar-type H+-ATPase subunit E/Vma4
MKQKFFVEIAGVRLGIISEDGQEYVESVAKAVNDRINQMDQAEKYNMIKQVLMPYVGDLVVTPKEIDSIISNVSEVVAHGINYALHAEETL